MVQQQADQGAIDPEELSLVKIDGVVIDELTGEVLEYPDGWQGDLLEHLIRQAVFAKSQQKDWDRTHDLYRFAIGKLMEARDVDRFSSDRAGRASLRSQTRRTATAERLYTLVQRKRLSSMVVKAIAAECIATFDVHALERLAVSLGAASSAAVIREELIDTKVSKFIQVDAPRVTAPNIIRLQQREGKQK